ncbi:MAG: BTAD domain-containing putative transcriptional regulator [Thermomicrobiales bacterium]
MPERRPAEDPTAPAPALQLRLLGGFAVVVDGQLVAERAWGGSRKAQHAVKLLALAPGYRLPLDHVLDALWPDLDPDAARRACYQALYLARRAVDPARRGWLTIRQEVVILAPAEAIAADLAAFLAAAERARRTRAAGDYAVALARYTGDLLPDDPYEEWAIAPRESARLVFLSLLREYAAAQEQTDREAAIATLERLVAAEPADEAAHVAIMRLHAEAGRRAQALAQFGQLRTAVKQVLDAEPEAASQQLYAAILAGRVTEGRGEKGEGRDENVGARHTLPAATTALLGREGAIEAIRAELATARLVTLVGTGGVGKTRLALAVARTLLDDYPGGVWLLDLAALHDGALLDATLARVIGLRQQSGQPLREPVIAALRDQPALVVLDNCEHLIAACADLAAALLAGCPELRILATSREALRVAGELAWRVPSLRVPGETPDLAALRDTPAVGLFLDRARFARPGFALTAENATAVATICRRLDGIPLAIELAAARIPVLAPQQLAARLDDALRLLTGGPRTALPRHQTLRATLEWSYQLLTTAERSLLDRLAVFAGGGTLAAIEAICDLGAATLDLLATLVDKSLVQVELGAGEEEPRYRLLETVRQFAAARLAGEGLAQTYQARHAAYFLRLAEEAEPALIDERQAWWLARLAREIDNLRAALAWCDAHDLATGLRLASALGRFWFSDYYYREGLAWLTTGLARAGETVAPVIRARANLAVSLLTSVRSDPRAIVFATAALHLYRELSDRDNEATAQTMLGTALLYAGDAEGGHAAFAEAMAIWRGVGNGRGVATASLNLAINHIVRDRWRRRARSPRRRCRWFASSTPRSLYTVLANLALSYASVGRCAEARALHAEAVELMASVRDWVHFSFGGLIVTALIANGLGEAERAAQFLGAAAQCRAIIGFTPFAVQERFIGRATEGARAGLGEAAYDAAFATGFTWTIEESVARTLAYLAD